MRALFSGWSSYRVSSSDGALGGIALLCILARFVGLERSPLPMWIDEWIGACQIACMATSGQSVVGEKWPLFVVAGGGGYVTPVYLYFGALWAKVFGLSPAALRSISALFVTLTILGVYCLGRRLGGARVGFWALVLASLSPWSFQFSRIAWDPPLAPAFVVWCCYFALLSSPVLGGSLAGIMAAGAMYSYPPQRIQVPLLCACLFLVLFRFVQSPWKRSGAFMVSSGLLAVPLVKVMLAPGFLNRGDGLAIFAKDYVEQHRGHLSGGRFIVETLLDNIALHLRPSFLFASGDANLRHSAQRFGELSLLDLFALGLGVCLVVTAVRGTRLSESGLRPIDRRGIALAVAGILTGILPAALTWEALPHALRAIGSWPFFSLLGGSLLAHGEQAWVHVKRLALAVATVQVVLFGSTYIGEYAQLSKDAFTASLFQSGMHWSHLPNDEKVTLARENRELVLYGLMVNGTHRCVESEQVRLKTLAQAQ